MRATIQSLEEIHPGRGREAFNRIAILSGTGSVGASGIGDDHTGGIDLTGYETNEAISAESRSEIARILDGGSLDDEEEESASDATSDEAEALVKRYSKDELSEFARQRGLDGNAHTNKLEMAKALIAAGFVIPKEGE